VKLPQVPRTESEFFGHFLGLVPKQAVFQGVGGGRVMDIEGGIIVGNLVHDATEHAEIRNHTRIIFPKGLAVPQITLPQDKDAVHIGPDHWLDVHTVLQGKDEPHFPMSTIFI
jgi:hypothetical protein